MIVFQSKVRKIYADLKTVSVKSYDFFMPQRQFPVSWDTFCIFSAAPQEVLKLSRLNRMCEKMCEIVICHFHVIRQTLSRVPSLSTSSFRRTYYILQRDLKARGSLITSLIEPLIERYSLRHQEIPAMLQLFFLLATLTHFVIFTVVYLDLIFLSPLRSLSHELIFFLNGLVNLIMNNMKKNILTNILLLLLFKYLVFLLSLFSASRKLQTIFQGSPRRCRFPRRPAALARIQFATIDETLPLRYRVSSDSDAV